MKKLGKKTVAKIICGLIILIIASISVYVFATQEVKIQISQTPNVDIILTKSKTQANIANFEEELKAELIRQKVMTQADIDAGKLNIEAIETKNVESQETLNWTESKNSAIGSITITNSGKDIFMQGNYSKPGKQAMWIIPDGNEEQEFEFGYSINYGDSFNAAGMLLRVQENENGSIEGYMVSFNNRGAFAIGSNAGLWHFIYNKNNYTSFSNNSDIWLVDKLNINGSGNLKIKVTDTDIRISGGGLADEYVYTMPKDKTYGSGYGFFSDHYSHGCDNYGKFTLTNIDLKVEVTKKFTEVLQAPTWRNGSTRILINVEDTENEEFSDSNELTEIITKLMNNNVYYIGWGTDENNEQINNIIQQNNNNGIYVENSSSDAVEATVNYLKKIIKPNVSNVIIAGEAVNVKITQPISGIVTTPTDQYPNGVWKVVHDYNYYENPQGQYEEDSMYSNNLINAFDNVGKYSIYCEDKLVTEVYAHRRPVASFNMRLDGQNLSLNSTSYDLDIERNSSEHDAQVANNGIKAEKWEYKKVGDTNSSWTEIKSNGIGKQVNATLDANTDYYIKLIVTDYQGVQTEAIKNVTTGANTMKPVAQFKVLEKEISVYEKLNIVDESYDPYGSELTYEWKVVKVDEKGTRTEVYTGNTPLVDFSTNVNESYGVGKYEIQLIVSKNDSGNIIYSNEFKQTITVTDDTTAPIVIIDPTTKKTYNEEISINVKLIDNESGLRKYKYAFTTSGEAAQDSDFTEVLIDNEKVFEDTLTIPTKDWDKELYLHVIAENNSGLETEERIVGKYYIEPTYEVIIQSVDSVTKTPVKDMTYDIIGEYADGTTIDIAKNEITDKNGKITINKAKLKDVKKLKIDNIEAVPGYEIAKYKNVNIDTSTYNIVVDSTSSSNDIETNISNGNQTLTVKVPVERKKFDLKITNIDETSMSLISNSKFVLKQGGAEVARGTTINGETTLTGTIAGVKTTKEYVLIQENVNEVYKNVGNITLKITFDEQGNVSKVEQKLFATNNAVSIPDNTKAELVIKNTRIDNSSFSVSINVKNASTGKSLQDSEYKIEVDDGKGLQYVTASAKTDAEGNLKIDGLYGKGLLKLTFKHVKAPAGYKLETSDKYITIQRNNDETIEYNNASIAGVYKNFDFNSKTIYTTLTNVEKATTNAIKIRTGLKNNDSVPVNNVGLKVYNIYSGQLVGEGKTDENGLLEIIGVTTDAEGDILYKIVPDDNSIVTSNIIFSVSYDRSGKIVGADATSADMDVNVYKTEDDDADYYKNTANVDIKIKQTAINGANKLVITNVSSLNGKALENIEYKVKIVGESITIDTYKTDSEGRIEAAIPNDNNIEVEIQEINTINGYKLDSQVKTIKLTRNAEGNLEKTYLNNINNSNVNIDSNGDLQVKEVSYSTENTSVVFKLAATNKNGTLNLAGVEFEITEPTSNYKQTVITDSNGYVSAMVPFSATNGQSYEYTITQKSTVAPYELPSNPIKMEMRFDKNNGIVRYLGESYLQGNEILASKSVNYDATNNEVTVELRVANYVDNDSLESMGRVYDIDITKVDSKGNVVSGSKYDIEIRPYAEQSIASPNTAITSDVEVTDLILKQDKTTIILTEKNAAIGCNLDNDTKVITLTLDSAGNIIWDKTTSSTKNINIDIVDSKDSNGNKRTMVKVTLTAELPQQVVEPGTSDKIYQIDLKKVDSNGNELTGSVYDVTIRPFGEAGSVDFGREVNQSVEYKSLLLKQNKTVITLKETKAANGYAIDGNTKVVSLELNSNNEIVLDSSSTSSDNVRVSLTDTKDANGNLVKNVLIELVATKNPTSTNTSSTPVPYQIDVKRVDKDGNELTGSIYDIEVIPYAMNAITYYNTAITNGVEIEGQQLEDGKTIVSFKETTAPNGYTANSNVKILVLQFDEKGNIETDKDATSKDIEVTIKDVKDSNGKTIKNIEVIIKENDGEVTPAESTVNFNIYNRRYGDWNHAYSYYHYNFYYYGWYRYIYEYVNETRYETYTGAQKLLDIFNVNETANKQGFNLINAFDIDIEARLVNNGVVETQIYETAKATLLDEPNDSNGTHNVALYKDYKNKTVEFTIKENIPDLNYKRNATDAKVVIKFDENGKVLNGEITAGLDMEEVAVGGISAEGVTTGIQTIKQYYYYRYMWYEQRGNGYTYNTYDINKFNSIGKNTIYLGLLNKSLNNPLSVTVNLKDSDTDDGLDGKMSLVITDITDSNRIVETNSINVKDGNAKITMKNTYANRELLFTLFQTTTATRGSRNYSDSTSKQIQFKAKTDDDGNIIELTQVNTPTNAVLEGATNANVEYTIYNDMVYNFAINLTKLDEKGVGLSGVRVYGKTSIIDNATTGAMTEVFTNGSALTDSNGNVKLKIDLPEKPDYNYYNKSIEIELSEYYVPDNYRAQTGMKIRVLFNKSGTVKEASLVSEEGDKVLLITNKNNEALKDIEKGSVDLTMVNSVITEKPYIDIVNEDIDDETIKLTGTRYKITVWDEDDYVKNTLVTNETKYSSITDENGCASILFDNAHALRTMIYQIQEVQTAHSYVKNEDIILKIKYDEEGKIASAPEIINPQTIIDAKGNNVPAVTVVGDPQGSEQLQLKIVNELEPKFNINIKREDTEGNTVEGRTFKVVVKEKDNNGEYNTVETRMSKETATAYTIGLKTDPASKQLLYSIYEETGNEFTLRGETEIEFDRYGKVKNGTIEGKYVDVDNSNISTGNDYIDVTILAEVFRIKINVEDTTKSGYDLSGYTFEVTNSKDEKSDTTVKTNSIGSVIEFSGEVYKGQTITYTIKQESSPVDYNDVETITITVEFDEDGKIVSCTPTAIEGKYDLVTTIKDTSNNANMELKLYTTPALRNTIEMTVVDENDNTKVIENAVYGVNINKDDKGKLLINDGEGTKDLGAYKNYAGNTVIFSIKQENVDNKYMINDKKIQISVTYSDEGLITDARVIASDGYIQIDTDKTIGTEKLVLKDANKRKVVMQLLAHSTEATSDFVQGATFEIQEVGKTTLYSDTKVTGTDGKATLYVGPYYRDVDVTYEIKNTKAAREYKKVEDAQFTLHYDANGKVTSANLSTNAQRYMNITIPTSETPDIEIEIQATPLFTIGVDAIDKNSGTRLVGGKYEITQISNTTNKDTVISESNSTAHAVIGETEIGKVVEYQIVEKGAPIGYKYISKDNVIGRIKVTYDQDGHIMQKSPTVTFGYNYITINDSTDKAANYDMDIQIKYEEVEEFKIIIENYDMLNNSQKLQSDFRGYISSGQSATTTTDPTSGIGVLSFGKLSKSRPVVTISQSNIQGNYLTIAQIKMRIDFDDSGKIVAVNTLGGNNVATEGVAYTIDSKGQYTLKITVKNNPLSSIKIVNIADGSSGDKLQSTYELSAANMEKIQMVTVNGEATATLKSVPKNTTVRYALVQTNVERGYRLNKNIVLEVHYDSNGIIDRRPYIVTGNNLADNSVVNVKSWSAYQVELEIKNKQVFEVYLKAQDAFDENIPLKDVAVRVRETTYSNIQLTLSTDSTGVAHSELGSTFAGRTLVYDVNVQNNLNGYDKESRNINAQVRIPFDANGNIDSAGISSSNSQVVVEYKSGLAIEITVKYIPVIQMEVTRRNMTTNEALPGKRMQISSSSMANIANGSTDANGKVTLSDAGKISTTAPVVYNVSEMESTGYSAIGKLDPFNITVIYDNKGYISGYTSTLTDNVTLKGIGTRKLEVEIGSDIKTRVGLVNKDYFIGTERITGTYEITSSKGETLTISAIKGTTSAIESLGKFYPGEEIEYVIHQTDTQNGYQAIKDTKFKVEYKKDGTIGNVTSMDTDVLTIGTVYQASSKTTANINLEIHSKPVLMVKLNVLDKQYNRSGVEGIGFKIKDETSGIETSLPYVTDSNGSVIIPVYEAYKNTHVTYTITQTNTKGAYKAIPSFKVVVEYDQFGTIVENGTYVIDASDVTLTQKYSERLYTNSKLRGIELNIIEKTELGVGIEKTDVNGVALEGIEYTIIAKDVSNSTENGTTKATNASGEITEYFGELPQNKIMEYTISELQAPAGYRKVADTIIRVYFDSQGRITSYTPVQIPSNVTVEVATDTLPKMSASRENVHIKLKIVNDNRVTFKIVNKQNVTEKPIQDAKFAMSAETVNGIISSVTANTNLDGEVTLANIDATGTIKFYFNQVEVPSGISSSNTNSGYITINKRADVYQLTLNDSTENLQYDIDSETGVVTVYLYNDNNLELNIIDVDAETLNSVLDTTHIVKAQYGNLEDDINTILNSTENQIIYNDGNAYASTNGKTLIGLGKTYGLANKKVIYTIETPTQPESYHPIGKVYLVVEFDNNGNISNVNGISSRLLSGTGFNGLTINAVVGYGDIDFYTITVAKQDSNTGLRMNGVMFDVNIEQNDKNVETMENLPTQEESVGGIAVDTGVINIKKLKYEGNIKLTLTEKNVPEGYKEDMLNVPTKVSFDLSLDRTDPNNVVLKLDNINSNGLDLTYNKYTKQILITIKNDPIIKFTLNKEDESGNPIVGMNFDVKLQEKDSTNIVNFGSFKTDDNGQIQFNIPNAYANKNVLIRLDETKVYEYQKIDPIIIDAYIDSNGQIKTLSLISGSDSTQITNATTSSLDIKVINKLEEYVKPYSITINKVDKNDHNIKLQNVLFQVKVVPEVGNPIYKNGKTDADGKLTIENLVGSGKIKIEVIEVLTPNGYEISNNNGRYSYEITKISDSLQKVASNNDDSLWNIYNDKVVDITIENQLEKIGIAFEKVDEENNMIKIQGAEYKLTNTSTGEEIIKESDNNGMIYFAIDKVFNTSPIAYTLEETKAPNGYELDSTVRTFYIQSDASTGNIKKIMDGNGLQILEQKEKYAKFRVTDKQKSIGVAPYKVELINVDSANSSIPVENATFDIKISQSVGVANISILDQKTDAMGHIPTITKINGAGNIRIDISNKQPGNGYEINNSPTYVELERDTRTGIITIKKAYGLGAIYEPETDTVKITFESSKEKNKYSLKLNVINKNTGDMIVDTNAKYNITINGNTISKNVDSNGQIILQGLDIPNAENFTISVKETQVPTGVNSIAEAQEVKAEVATIYGDRYIKDASITSGSNLEIQQSSSMSLELVLLYEGNEENPDMNLYLESNVYRVTKDYVERVNSNTTVADFLANMNSNGTMTVYDKDGNVVSTTSLVGTGMKIIATKEDAKIEKEISVIGDITGNGRIRTLDINKMKQHIIGSKELTGAYLLAADINDDGKVRTLDVNKAKQIMLVTP